MEILSAFLFVLIGGIHIVFGEMVQMKILKDNTREEFLVASMRIMIYQGGILLIITGIVQMMNALEILTLSGLSAYIPLFVLLVNFVPFVFTALIKYRKIFIKSLFQVIYFIILIILQIIILG
ncbi:MAG TPA: hypothetical protein PLS66_01520 [Tepiditoga sp.]|nr:hypothetical protein [Thermotogota bacterium]HOO73947.1 hypothetical protein [Tepiditoga sp.]